MAYDDLLEKAAPKSQATTGFWGNLQKKKDAATLRKAETTSATTGGFLIKPTEKLTIGDKENIAKKPMVSAYDKLKTNKMDLDLFGIDSEKERKEMIYEPNKKRDADKAKRAEKAKATRAEQRAKRLEKARKLIGPSTTGYKGTANRLTSRSRVEKNKASAKANETRKPMPTNILGLRTEYDSDEERQMAEIRSIYKTPVEKKSLPAQNTAGDESDAVAIDEESEDEIIVRRPSRKNGNVAAPKKPELASALSGNESE